MTTKHYTLYRRTFEAAKHPKGSVERTQLNCDVRTSEYMTSYRYTMLTPAFMSDGSPNLIQKFFHWDFRTKHEAELFISKTNDD